MKFEFRWLVNNFALKFVSLLLAIGFWFYVVGEESVEVRKSVPLEIAVPSEKITVLKSSVPNLEVMLQVPRHLLAAVSNAELKAVHRIENVETAGEYSFSVAARDIRLLAPEVHVVRIFPTLVTVTLDEVIVKKLPIKVDFVGEPASGYRVDSEMIELDPNAILMEGPKGVLETLNSVPTESVQLVGRIRSFQRKIRIREVQGARPIGEGFTDALIPIKADFVEKEFQDVKVKPLGLPAGRHYVHLSEDQVSVTLKGPLAILKDITAQDLLAYVDVDGFKEGSRQVTVQFVFPTELTIKGSPPQVAVEVIRFKA